MDYLLAFKIIIFLCNIITNIYIYINIIAVNIVYVKTRYAI